MKIEKKNREIKFRIWFNEPGAPPQMIYPHICDFIKDEDGNVIGQIFLLNSYQKGFEISYKVVNLAEYLLKDQIGSLSDTWWDADNSILMQYTGLRDKNNIETYEGDIVVYYGDCDITYSLPGTVSIGEYFTHEKECRHYGVRVKRTDMDLYFGLKPLEEFIVIGSIFENGEILSQCACQS